MVKERLRSLSLRKIRTFLKLNLISPMANIPVPTICIQSHAPHSNKDLDSTCLKNGIRELGNGI